MTGKITNFWLYSWRTQHGRVLSDSFTCTFTSEVFREISTHMERPTLGSCPARALLASWVTSGMSLIARVNCIEWRKHTLETGQKFQSTTVLERRWWRVYPVWACGGRGGTSADLLTQTSLHYHLHCLFTHTHTSITTILESNVTLGIVQLRYDANSDLQDKKFDEFVQVFPVLWAQIAVHHDPSLRDIRGMERENERENMIVNLFCSSFLFYCYVYAHCFAISVLWL